MSILPTRCSLLSTALLAAGLASLAVPPSVRALPLAQAAAAPASNLVGTVTVVGANALTVKLESGSEATIGVTPQTRLLRTAPGEKTLKGATAIHLEDFATGDRVLMLRPVPGGAPGQYSAAAIVTMKQADIAQAHATQSEDWQRRGVGGIVKSIETGAAAAAADPNSAIGPTIVVSTAQPGRTLAIHVTPATTIRRYASDSINFADAKPAALADIHPGDQLRARGDRNAENTQLTAVEIVAGSFRNIAGTITAIDPALNTVTVTDLATKKPVTLRLTAETQMRKLPAEMAQQLAGRGGQPGESRPGGSGPPPAANAHPADTPGAGPRPSAGAPGGSTTRGRGDAAAMLQRAPSVTLAELKKGDAIMVVAARAGTSASGASTAITLIAGVEPLLEGSSGSASQNLFSASWNLGGGGGGAEAAQ